MTLQAVFLCDTDLVIKVCQIMTTKTNVENLRQYKSRFSLIEEQILAFASSIILVREVKTACAQLIELTFSYNLTRNFTPFPRNFLF